MSKLALRNLGKRFGDAVAVDGVNLEIEPGEFVSLLGPSGCGKTTTLRMIAGFIDPTTGTIETDGKVLSSPSGSLPPERRQMSMIFQSYAIWPNMTVEENVAFGLQLRNLPAAEVRKRVGEMLEVVHLGPLARRYPAELSGGQQQRVALARAIVIQPAVLLAALERAVAQQPASAHEDPVLAQVEEVLDEASLIALVSSDAKLLREVAGYFLEDSPQRLTEMRVALEAGDLSSLRTAAHTLKGSAGSLCGRVAAERAQRIERLAQDGDLTQARTSYPALCEDVTRLQQALTSLVGRYDEHDPDPR
ncbi:MAG: hypothetical protein NVS4B10_14500 [Myxococcales bacterium]